MSKVVTGLSVSLDGFIAGPNDGPARSVGVGAANVAQQYLKAGLLDEIHLNVVPALLGGGVSFFGNLAGRQFGLECTRVVESDGVTHLSYRVIK
jgi:dihydrofolate reductase